MRIRRGGAGDAPLMLAMLDGAVAWLTAHGRTGQWGSEPWSVRLLRVDCHGGGDGRLAEYYRRNGFETVAEFTLGDWPGRLMAQRTGG